MAKQRRWSNDRTIDFSVGLAVVLVTLAAQKLFITHVEAHGVETKPVGQLPSFLPFSLLDILTLGSAIVAIAVWQYVTSAPPGKARPEQRITGVMRLYNRLKLAGLLLSALTIPLFLPYIVSSNWFAGFLGTVSTRLEQLRQPLTSFYEWVIPLIKYEGLWKMAIAQNISLILLALLGAIIGKRGRKTRPAK